MEDKAVILEKIILDKIKTYIHELEENYKVHINIIHEYNNISFKTDIKLCLEDYE